jgi:hypothetical protein
LQNTIGSIYSPPHPSTLNHDGIKTPLCRVRHDALAGGSNIFLVKLSLHGSRKPDQPRPDCSQKYRSHQQVAPRQPELCCTRACGWLSFLLRHKMNRRHDEISYHSAANYHTAQDTSIRANHT